MLRQPDGAAPRPALFFDRDGVVVEEVGHLQRAEDVRLIAGAADAIRAANGAGLPVVVVSNQSGVGRRLFDWDDFAAVQERLLQCLAAESAFLDAVFACPHHALGEPPYDRADHPARKPNPGMILAAARLLPLHLPTSWIVGDRASDIAAGRNAGLAGGLHVATGLGARRGERAAALSLAASEGFVVLAAPSIAAAPALLPLFSDATRSGRASLQHSRAAQTRP